jgi:nicotinamidase-related amidase
MTDLALDPARTAVLSMDCQAAIVSAYVKPPEPFLDRAVSVLAAARRAKMTVIHVQVSFRPGLPEIHAHRGLFVSLKSDVERQQLFKGPGGAIHLALGPEPGDLVVTKRRISAFTGSDLDVVLRANDIETMVMFGIATSGVVVSTLLQAVDSDYRAVIVGDCCEDQDAELHATLIEKFFPRRGTVLSAREFVERVKQP